MPVAAIATSRADNKLHLVVVDGVQDLGKVLDMGLLGAGTFVEGELLRSAVCGPRVDDDGAGTQLDTLVQLVNLVAIAHHANRREDLYRLGHHDECSLKMMS